METEAKLESSAVRSAAFSLLIVDDEVTTQSLCNDVAREAGLHVYTSSTTEQALEILDQYPIDIVVTDLKVPQIGGLELIKRTRTSNPQVAVIVLTQYGTIETAIEATRLGAVDYVTKPFHVEELRTKLDRLVHSIELDQENRLLREQLRSRPGFGGLIGVSPKMQRVYKLIEKVAQHTYPVLILGESGTGKELVSRSIHFSGPRNNKPFSPVDCSALVPTLIESELFGYVKGAFTGAQHSKQGLFEAAGDGTLFLDEIGELPAALQARLLGVLQDRAVTPSGGVPVDIDISVICATHHRLADLVRAGDFREDLYYRLNGLTLHLPPLRNRKDIIELAKALDAKETRAKRHVDMSEEVLQIFVHHPWPGNVRQMHSVIRTAIAMVDEGERVERRHLPEDFLAQMEQGTAPSAAYVSSMESLEKIELNAIQETIRHNHGNISAAARQLGVSRTTLYRKLKQTSFLPSSASAS